MKLFVHPTGLPPVMSSDNFMSGTMLRYKYIPFDEGSLCILKDGTMKFTRPSEFNDPFDCDPEVDEHQWIKYIKSEGKDLLKRAADSLGLSPAKRIQQKNVMLKRLTKAFQNGEFGQKAVNDVGICCLSRDPLNLLMWAHYAKDHTGFVIEFCIPTETSTYGKDDILNWLFPLEVKYQKEKPLIDNPRDKNIYFDKQFLIKGLDWEYEQEERVIDHWRGFGIHRYDRKTILKSVIAGVRMCDEHFVILKNTIDTINAELGINVEVYKAQILKGKFALFIPERGDLASNPRL
jgi:hypothetical protein